MVSNNSTATRLKFDVFRRCNYFLARLGVDSKWNNEKKKKKSPGKIYIYISGIKYISRIDTEIAIGVPRVIFFLFSNQIWELESLRTLEHEEERYAIEWITDEKSCEKKIRKLIGHWNSMPERNSGVSKSGGSWNHFYLSIRFSAITSIT